MSARRRARARAAGALLLALYPEPWRERYGEEMLALLDDDPPGLRGLLSLVRGAGEAHLRNGRWRSRAPLGDRVRLSLCGMFACWIALSITGVAFQKETEERSFSTLADHHWLLSAAHDTVLAGALLGAGAIALGGLPLLLRALLTAARTRERRLAGALALPLAGLALFLLVTVVVIALAPAEVGRASLAEQLAILLPWWAAGLAFALSCALAPRLALRRVQMPIGALRRAALAGPLLLAAMVLVSVGVLSYDVALAVVGPPRFAESGGPVWPSTGTTLAVAGLTAAICTALAALAAARAWDAARTAAAD